MAEWLSSKQGVQMIYTKLKDTLPANVFAELPAVTEKYQICTPLRLAHFLAQCAHESGSFKYTEENLNYSLEALLRVFPKYFTPENVAFYVRKPLEIASRVYANRMGNGPEECCDGWFYRWRGYIQLTGKDNYEKFGAGVSDNLIDHPELVATKYPLLSAAWFWTVEKRLNELADLGPDQQIVADITRKVNGGYHGLENRLKLFDRYYGQIPH